MTILNYAKQQMALIIGGSTTTIPIYAMIGSGSGTLAVTQTALIAPEDRQLFTDADVSTKYNVKWTSDWTANEMSGLSLREFGVTASGTGLTGSMWTRSTCPNLIFDGTSELRIEEVIKVY